MLYMIICLLCVSLANAQNNNPLNNSPDKDTIQEVFVDSVIHPKFPGGDEALMQYLSENLVYPPIIQNRRFKGKVLVQFVVETDGSISNVEVVRSLYKDLDEEVVRVIKNMPKWIPAEQDGKAIREYYKLPISFELADNSTTTDSSSNNTIQEENERVFVEVEQLPEFPGGKKAFIQYLNENLVYPKSAYERKVEGKVVVSFVVEADGSITNVKVANSVDEDLDKEAVRVVKAMPKWIPGKHKGKAVPVLFRCLPINFQL
ncbi:MAG: energy transducer TonB [Bacteroidales bacterium]|nr:energy transducer TonB [Bacteroidales bacterium]